MIDLSNYSCDKCKRVGSWHCKHCWHTADKPPTRFKKKKKTGCETPEFRKPSTPPPNSPRRFCRNVIDTKEEFDKLTERPDDLIRMDGAEVYFSVKSGLTVIITTQEWKDYFLGRGNIIPNTKESS